MPFRCCCIHISFLQSPAQRLASVGIRVSAYSRRQRNGRRRDHWLYVIHHLHRSIRTAFNRTAYRQNALIRIFPCFIILALLLCRCTCTRKIYSTFDGSYVMIHQ